MSRSLKRTVRVVLTHVDYNYKGTVSSTAQGSLKCGRCGMTSATGPITIISEYL